MGRFCKTGDCPTSESLLAFGNGQSDAVSATAIRQHIAVCEFCSAEVELYGLYPPLDETVTIEGMPEPLRELAEALLKKKSGLRALSRMAGEID